MDVKLNFINNSNDVNNSEVVILQKNIATDFDELTVAWQVIRYCGKGDNHPFILPKTMQIGASDSYGNFTPQLPAHSGQLFHMVMTPSGDLFELVGSSTSPEEVQVRNALGKGAINVCIYKGGRLLAIKTSIAPQQKAAFAFNPTLWIGVASQIDQGQVMNSAILATINTELNLQGIASADIVMTGGGPGADATPFNFSLENIVTC